MLSEYINFPSRSMFMRIFSSNHLGDYESGPISFLCKPIIIRVISVPTVHCQPPEKTRRARSLLWVMTHFSYNSQMEKGFRQTKCSLHASIETNCSISFLYFLRCCTVHDRWLAQVIYEYVYKGKHEDWVHNHWCSGSSKSFLAVYDFCQMFSSNGIAIQLY